MRILVKILFVKSLTIILLLLIIILIVQLLNIFSVLLVIIVILKPLSWRVWLLSRIEIVLWELAIIVLLMLCIILICLLPTCLFFWQILYWIRHHYLWMSKITFVVDRFRYTLLYLSILDLDRRVIDLIFVRYTL